MKFFKTNSYDIVRLYINQVGITIFSLALYFAVGTIENNDVFNKIRIAVSAFAFLFYLALIYCVVWEIGAKDKIRVDGGKLAEDKFKGLKLSLFANVPNFVLSLISLLLLVVFILSGGEGFKAVFAVFYLILRFHCSMLLGMITGFTPTFTDATLPEYYNDCLVECILYLVIPFISLAVSHFAYRLGSMDKKLFGGKSQSKKK